MTSTLLGASMVAYFIASVLYLANLHIRRSGVAGYAAAVSAVGFALQTVRLAMQMAVHITPFANAVEAVFFLSWAIAGTYLLINWRFRVPAVGALAMPLSLIVLALAYRLPTEASRELASGPWLRMHVVAIVASFALFILAFCCGVFYLVQNKLLKSKRLHGMFRKLPPLETVDSLAYHLAAVGFPLLTLGIATAIVGVAVSSLRSGASEMRLLAAGLTWAVYAAYLLAHGSAAWRGRRANWILIIGAVLIAATTVMHGLGNR